MLKICKNCERYFRTYMPNQIFCCYDCKADFSAEDTSVLSIDEILAINGLSYGRTVFERNNKKVN